MMASIDIGTVRGATDRDSRMADDYNARTHAAFAAALARIDALDREPTSREQDCLAFALAYMACGNYRLARVELRSFSRAMVSGDRSPASGERSFTMAMLRRGHLRLGAFV